MEVETGERGMTILGKRLWLVAAVAVIVFLIIVRPSDEGAPYDDYFSALNDELRANGPGLPVLVLDLDRLDHNIEVLKQHIRPPKAYRVVCKSLPSIDLIRYIMAKAGTNRVMVFHQPFINILASQFPGSDLLLGKPMPVRAASAFYDRFSPESTFDPSRRLQWLIDSPARLEQYRRLACDRGLKMQVNVEIDVGLHRGGVRRPEDLAPILRVIEEDPEHLAFSGFMGYEAHAAHAMPLVSSPSRVLADVLERYRTFVAYGRERFPRLFTGTLTLNGAGSKTYQLYDEDSLVNDLSAGSGLVMPTDFDGPALADHVPALFIAAPILKKSRGTRIPYIEFLSPLIGLWNPNRAWTFFLYGGHWMAESESPAGLKENRLYGLSSNQQIINGSGAVDAGVDDYVFMRPTQSEAVMLQFGDLLVVRGGKIIGRWPVFRQEG